MKILWVPLLIVLSVSCKKAWQGSELSHDSSRSVNDESPYQWHDTSDDEYFTNIKHPAEVTRNSAFPNNHAGVKRLQFWVDALDSMLRKREGSKLNLVPKPRVKLIKFTQPNAYVAVVPICLNFKGMFEGGQTASAEEVEMLGFMRKSGDFAVPDKGQITCAASRLSQDEQIALLKWQLRPYSQCSFTVKDGTVVFAQACLGQNRALANVKGSRILVQAISNQVTFYSKMLQILDEDEMVAVMAHELGHYYMAHGVTPESQYGMFYRHGLANPSQKPTSDPEAEAFGKRLNEILRYDVQTFAPVQGQKYHSILFEPINQVAYQFSNEELCKNSAEACKPCRDLRQFVVDAQEKEIFGQFPRARLQQTQELSYQNYEKLAEACTSRIRLSQDPNAIGALPLNYFTQILADTSPSFVGYVQALPLKNSLHELLFYLGEKAQLLAKDLAVKQPAILTEALKFNLVVYTAEQEADELSTEWLRDLGLNPASGIGATIKFGKAQPESPAAVGEIKAAQCEQLYKNKWRDDKGNPVMVPVAIWLDEHHSDCFRAFNIDREIQVHQYNDWASKTRPAAQLPAWSEILKGMCLKPGYQ